MHGHVRRGRGVGRRALRGAALRAREGRGVCGAQEGQVGEAGARAAAGGSATWRCKVHGGWSSAPLVDGL